MLRDLFLGFIKMHILHHTAHDPVFGLALIRELACHGSPPVCLAIVPLTAHDCLL